MHYDNIKIMASPQFTEVTCPKHRIVMFEIEDGWLKSAWYCPKCKVPYTIGIVKIKKWSKKALSNALRGFNSD